MQQQVTIFWKNGDAVTCLRRRRSGEAVESNDANMVDHWQSAACTGHGGDISRLYGPGQQIEHEGTQWT